jgi:hypothetical protein
MPHLPVTSFRPRLRIDAGFFDAKILVLQADPHIGIGVLMRWRMSALDPFLPFALAERVQPALGRAVEKIVKPEGATNRKYGLSVTPYQT